MKRYNNRYNASLTGHIEVRQHAIDRFRLRQQNLNMSDKEVIQKIINQVRHSKLININGKEEHRSHNGNVYVIMREFQKDTLGLLQEKITVVTMKLSKIRIRENFSQDFSMETIDIDSLIGPAC